MMWQSLVQQFKDDPMYLVIVVGALLLIASRPLTAKFLPRTVPNSLAFHSCIGAMFFFAVRGLWLVVWVMAILALFMAITTVREMGQIGTQLGRSSRCQRPPPYP